MFGGLAHICAVQRQWAEAARLFGAAEALQQALSPFFRHSAGNELTTLRAKLGKVAFAAAWAAGHAFSPEQAVDYALALTPIPVSASPFIGSEPVAPALPSYPAGLTAREVEVLRLLVQGLTYAEIADKLVVSRRTVNAHVTSIYGKLGVTSRAEDDAVCDGAPAGVKPLDILNHKKEGLSERSIPPFYSPVSSHQQAE